MARADLGETDWERRLIRRLRILHYQWRTEEAYRGWAWRFAQWLEEGDRSRLETAPTRTRRRVEEATEDDIRAFLSELATRQRLSASSQKQALNALVFLLREAHGRELGDFSDFTRACRRLRVSVFLQLRSFVGYSGMACSQTMPMPRSYSIVMKELMRYAGSQ